MAYLWENRLASRQVTMKDAQASSSSLYLSSTPTRPLNIDQQSCSDPRTHPLLHCTCFLLHRRTNAARSWGQWNWWSLCAFINIKTLPQIFTALIKAWYSWCGSGCSEILCDIKGWREELEGHVGHRSVLYFRASRKKKKHWAALTLMFVFSGVKCK